MIKCQWSHAYDHKPRGGKFPHRIDQILERGETVTVAIVDCWCPPAPKEDR